MSKSWVVGYVVFFGQFLISASIHTKQQNAKHFCLNHAVWWDMDCANNKDKYRFAKIKSLEDFYIQNNVFNLLIQF